MKRKIYVGVFLSLSVVNVVLGSYLLFFELCICTIKIGAIIIGLFRGNLSSYSNQVFSKSRHNEC